MHQKVVEIFCEKICTFSDVSLILHKSFNHFKTFILKRKLMKMKMRLFVCTVMVMLFAAFSTTKASAHGCYSHCGYGWYSWHGHCGAHHHGCYGHHGCYSHRACWSYAHHCCDTRYNHHHSNCCSSSSCCDSKKEKKNDDRDDRD
jgi:hypothetical protein